MLTPPMSVPKTLLWLVTNRASGSNDDDTLGAVISALTASGHAPAKVIDCAADPLPTRADLEAAGVGVLAVFTGDGTLSAAVPPLAGWAGHVLVLPGGTSNLLAHVLHQPCETAAIIAALADGTARSIQRPCVHAGQHTALCEVLAGPGAKWSDVREELREGDLGTIAASAIDAVKHSASGAMVLVAEPALGHAEGYAGVRIVPTELGLTTDGYRADGVSDLLKHGAALLKRDFREGPHDELGTHPELLCRSADGSAIELMIDGERVTGAPQERFSLAMLAVNLLATGHD